MFCCVVMDDKLTKVSSLLKSILDSSGLATSPQRLAVPCEPIQLVYFQRCALSGQGRHAAIGGIAASAFDVVQSRQDTCY